MCIRDRHYWQDVPFVEYINNEERLGDFEGVITEIDAYNKVQSNTATVSYTHLDVYKRQELQQCSGHAAVGDRRH